MDDIVHQCTRKYNVSEHEQQDTDLQVLYIWQRDGRRRLCSTSLQYYCTVQLVLRTSILAHWNS
jgi:hypothetical protein